MAMNPMQRKMRNAFLLGFLISIIIGAVAVGLLFMKIKSLREEQEALKKSYESQYTEVLVLNSDVRENQLLNGDAEGKGAMLEPKSVDKNSVPENALTYENIENYKVKDESGKEYYSIISKIPLEAGTVVTEDMVQKEGTAGTFRQVEYSSISLPSKLEVDDYIDIRIKYFNGVDLVVVSKVKVEEVGISHIWLTLSEGQLLTLNNALIESYIIDGAYLYATRYPNAAQPALAQTYTPNPIVISLISGLAGEDPDNPSGPYSDIEAAIIEAERNDISREFIDSLLQQFGTEETQEKATEGFDAEKASVSEAREALLGDLGY